MSKKTKIFFDCEFTGLHKNTTLISIGLISNCGKTFYAEFTDYDKGQVDDWIKRNVISKLKNPHHIVDDCINIEGDYQVWGKKHRIKFYLEKWLSQFDQVEMWSDCLSYDWVLFNDIFGTAFDIPKNIYYIPFDICTLFKIKGIDPDISREEFAKEDKINWFAKEEKHNALFDAKIIAMCYDKLTKITGKI